VKPCSGFPNDLPRQFYYTVWSMAYSFGWNTVARNQRNTHSTVKDRAWGRWNIYKELISENLPCFSKDQQRAIVERIQDGVRDARAHLNALTYEG
jgi:hypothetical protein